jgi:ubiquinone/menaquinone biosynthesis C-methylase UbiE
VILEGKKPRRIAGCDRSEDGLAAARFAFGDRVELFKASCESMPFPDRCFDVVVSALLLNLVANSDRAIKEMLRVLRPGGVAAAYIWDFGVGMQAMRMFWDAAIALNARAAERDQLLRSTETMLPQAEPCREGDFSSTRLPLWALSRGHDNILPGPQRHDEVTVMWPV